VTASSSIGFACTSSREPRVLAARAKLPFVPRRVVEVLRPVVDGFDESRWAVRKLADGRQARIFSVRARDSGTLLSGDDDAEELIVKVYRVDDPAHREAARDEFECLCRLHSRLDGATLHGWKVRCPRPLHCFDTSATLVMTCVPGRTLSWHLARGAGPAAEVLDSISQVTVSSLLRYWSGEPRLYGDLILNNVLCDLPTRTLALVDPGMPERFYRCGAAPRSFYPASRDLGFLLFWMASLIRPSIAHPALHARQKMMATRIVRTFLKGLGSAAERSDATAEIETCARLHLGRISVSASPRGLWRRFVKRAATRTIEQVFQEL
jgi:hypothetical protein